jgi:hypothetical protein
MVVTLEPLPLGERSLLEGTGNKQGVSENDHDFTARRKGEEAMLEKVTAPDPDKLCR